MFLSLRLRSKVLLLALGPAVMKEINWEISPRRDTEDALTYILPAVAVISIQSGIVRVLLSSTWLSLRPSGCGGRICT